MNRSWSSPVDFSRWLTQNYQSVQSAPCSHLWLVLPHAPRSGTLGRFTGLTSLNITLMISDSSGTLQLHLQNQKVQVWSVILKNSTWWLHSSKIWTIWREEYPESLKFHSRWWKLLTRLFPVCDDNRLTTGVHDQVCFQDQRTLHLIFQCLLRLCWST